MTKRVKEDIKNYLQAIGGIKSIYHKDRFRYVKALIEACNSLEEHGLYEKTKSIYYFSISRKPFIFNSNGKA